MPSPNSGRRSTRSSFDSRVAKKSSATSRNSALHGGSDKTVAEAGSEEDGGDARLLLPAIWGRPTRTYSGKDEAIPAGDARSQWRGIPSAM
jgi:hypothetical protein